MVGKNKNTNETIDNKLKERGLSFIRIDDYITTKTAIRWKCLIDGHIWKNKPNNIFSSNQGCPKCAKQIPKTDDDINLELLNRNIIKIDPYKNAKTSLRWECCICKNIWKATPTKVLNQKTGCPTCAGRPVITNDVIDKRIIEKSLLVIRNDNYVNAHTKIKWSCVLNSNHSWYATPKDVINKGTGCPFCCPVIGGVKTQINNIIFGSKLEAQLFNELTHLSKKYMFTVDRQVRYNQTSRHTCDFYIKELSLWIEVGNFKTPKYLSNIDQKRKWITDEKQEFFIFGNNVKTIISQLIEMINQRSIQ